MPRSRHALPAAAQALHFASAPYTPTAVEEQRYHDLMQEARYSIEAREEEGQARARLMRLARLMRRARRFLPTAFVARCAMRCLKSRATRWR